MMETKFYLPEDFEEKTDNLYEAIMIVARRARKISANQKLEIENTMHIVESEEEIIEDENREEPTLYLELEKPTRIAFRELSEDDLDFDYRE